MLLLIYFIQITLWSIGCLPYHHKILSKQERIVESSDLLLTAGFSHLMAYTIVFFDKFT